MNTIRHMRQADIAKRFAVSQSTISAALARERDRITRERLKTAEASDLSEFDSNEITDTSAQALDSDETYFANEASRNIDNAAFYLGQLVKDMQDDLWQPGGLVVARILDKSNENLMQIYDRVCKLMRLHSRQSTRLYGNPMQDRLTDEFARVMTVAEDAANWED